MFGGRCFGVAGRFHMEIGNVMRGTFDDCVTDVGAWFSGHGDIVQHDDCHHGQCDKWNVSPDHQCLLTTFRVREIIPGVGIAVERDGAGTHIGRMGREG